MPTTVFDPATLIPFALFGAVFLALFGALSLLFRVRARDLRHLGAAAAEEPTLAALRPVLERLAYLASLLPQQGHREWARLQITRANLQREWSAELLEAVKLLCGVAVFLATPLLCLALDIGWPWPLAALAAVVAWYLPDLALLMQANERQDAMRKSLPFVIDLLSVSAEAGLAFQQAIRNVVENSRRGGGEGGERQMVQEFEILLRDMQMGRTLSEAMEATARRVSLDEFNIFASAILQSERLGTAVSETLKRQSNELRAKLAARIETKANQAPVKIIFPLILFIFPVTGWVIIGPVLLQVFTDG
jgi:tight adherence protein C